MTQNEDESVELCITRLRQQAVLCEFDKRNGQIRDQVIEKCRFHKIRTKLLEKGHYLKLDQLRTIALTIDLAEQHTRQIESLDKTRSG